MKATRRQFLNIAAGLSLSCAAAPLLAQSAASGKKLIVYFSWSGNTQYVAKLIKEKTGADIIELQLVKPYSSNYSQCLDEAKRDQRADARPELGTKIDNIAEYDTIFIGYPNWWASIPMPIATFLESYDLSGKTLAPFCSHGGGRLGQSVTAISKLAPASTVTEGLSVHYRGGSSLPNDIDKWLAANKLL
ncbi:MAG TPA: NAD(P)H-dependent oxidoreductase [Candidatus Aphodousia faecavium]|nr:NAD(P)H-dependent oxidoreductase [Candidatus Aphodousia faecavium]